MVTVARENQECVNFGQTSETHENYKRECPVSETKYKTYNKGEHFIKLHSNSILVSLSQFNVQQILHSSVVSTNNGTIISNTVLVTIVILDHRTLTLNPGKPLPCKLISKSYFKYLLADTQVFVWRRL